MHISVGLKTRRLNDCFSINTAQVLGLQPTKNPRSLVCAKVIKVSAAN